MKNYPKSPFSIWPNVSHSKNLTSTTMSNDAIEEIGLYGNRPG